MPSSIGIVGYGSFGAFLELLLRRFAPEVEIRIHSSRFPADGKKFFSLAETAGCDAVILACPIGVFEQVLIDTLPHLGEKTVIVDVATVKLHTLQALKRLAHGRRFISTHPMFGPESYAKRGESVEGFRIVVADHTLPQTEYEALSAFLARCGFAVVRMSAEEHDKHLAETLFLTHFLGQTIARAGFDRTSIDTVSFGFLMDAVESVRHDTALFRDVYRFNPYCEEVLQRLEIAQDEVHKLLERGQKLASS